MIASVQAALLPQLHLSDQAASRMLRFPGLSLRVSSIRVIKFASNTFNFKNQVIPGGVPVRNKGVSAETVRYAHVTLKAIIIWALVTKFRKIAYFVAFSDHVNEAACCSLRTLPINTRNELLSRGRFISITKNVVFAHKNMGIYCVISFSKLSGKLRSSSVIVSSLKFLVLRIIRQTSRK